MEEALNLKHQGNDQEQTQEQIIMTTEATDKQNDEDDLKVCLAIQVIFIACIATWLRGGIHTWL